MQFFHRAYCAEKVSLTTIQKRTWLHFVIYILPCRLSLENEYMFYWTQPFEKATIICTCFLFVWHIKNKFVWSFDIERKKNIKHVENYSSFTSVGLYISFMTPSASSIFSTRGVQGFRMLSFAKPEILLIVQIKSENLWSNFQGTIYTKGLATFYTFFATYCPQNGDACVISVIFLLTMVSCWGSVVAPPDPPEDMQASLLWCACSAKHFKV